MLCKVKWSRYSPGVAQRVGTVIALLFHDRGTRRWWVVSSTPRPHFTRGKDTVPILQEAGWAPGPVRTGGKSLPHQDSILNRPAFSQSLYRLSYRPTHHVIYVSIIKQVTSSQNFFRRSVSAFERTGLKDIFSFRMSLQVTCWLSGSHVSWGHALRGEYSLRLLEKWILRKIFWYLRR